MKYSESSVSLPFWIILFSTKVLPKEKKHEELYNTRKIDLRMVIHIDLKRNTGGGWWEMVYINHFALKFCTESSEHEHVSWFCAMVVMVR